jgi:nitrogen PTS system EIIA component
MQLTVRDVSKLLNVSEKTIYRWIKQKTIPTCQIHDQYRFNRSELLEWAAAQKIAVSPEIFKEPQGEETVSPRLTEAIKTGGIYFQINGKDKKSVLRSVVDVLQLPEDFDRNLLYEVLLAREELGSTGVGEGIAIPHARNPIILNVPQAVISLCFLEHPVDFGALDGQPVHCLFIVISSTVRMHLQILSQIAFALKDSRLKETILRHGSSEEIFIELERVEMSLKKNSSAVTI